MLARFKNYLKFRVERLLLRGAHSRLLFIASLIGVVAVSGGLMVRQRARLLMIAKQPSGGLFCV